ncbi:MAG TPA: ECF transporter S component [Clostridiaceae bacterium]|nr:ECF transporter S component [Clostridiaceae bacterium]
MTESRNRHEIRLYVHKLTVGGMLLALALIIPYFFHLAGGPSSGRVFLPMHIPVLLGGIILGPFFGAIVGGLSPFVSSLITSMPPAPIMPFMVLELAVYGFVAGLIYHTFGFHKPVAPFIQLIQKMTSKSVSVWVKRLESVIITLVAAMVFGRLVYAGSLYLLATLFEVKGANVASVWAAVSTGLFGIGIQLIVIPPIVLALHKGGFINGFFVRGKKTT